LASSRCFFELIFIHSFGHEGVKDQVDDCLLGYTISEEGVLYTKIIENITVGAVQVAQAV